MAAWIERVMATRNREPVGFDVVASPWALLRDRASFEYSGSPSIGLGDVADGYIYLKDWRDLRHCSWQPGYITDEMFAAHKPMYQALARHAGRSADTSAEMNAVFRDMK
jgi:hypothetical protein